MRPDRDRLEDILEAIEEIRGRLPETIEAWMASKLLQVWVVHHLQVIGEAANSLSPGLVAAHPEVPGRASPTCGTSSFTSTSASISRPSGAR